MIIKIIGITARTIGSFYYPPIGRLWEALKRNILSCLFFQPVHNPLNKFSGRLLLIFLRHQLIPFIIIGKITYFYQYSRNCCILKNILIDLQWRKAMVQATFTIHIRVAFSPLPEELPHTLMNWPDARSDAVASDISDLAPPS